MAYIGLPYYGYCPITVTTNDDGTETESMGAGKITRAVISYAGENDSDSSELWAGDRREQRDSGSPSAKMRPSLAATTTTPAPRPWNARRPTRPPLCALPPLAS